jgi:hypothetical protein
MWRVPGIESASPDERYTRLRPVPPLGQTDLLPLIPNLPVPTTVSGLPAAIRAIPPPPRQNRSTALETLCRVTRVSPRS